MNSAEAKKILSLYKNLSFIDRIHVYIRLRRLNFKLIEQFVPRSGIILDFGCGHGFFSLYLEHASKKRTIIGTDVSIKKIQNANESKHGSRVKFILDKKGQSLEKKNYYDCVISLNVLYLLNESEQQDIIKKIYLSLKKDGIFILSEPDANHWLTTGITTLREYVMVKILRLTDGKTVLFHKKEWWDIELKKQFATVNSVAFMKSNAQRLFAAVKNEK